MSSHIIKTIRKDRAFLRSYGKTPIPFCLCLQNFPIFAIDFQTHLRFKAMSKSILEQIEYIVVLITEFAKAHGITTQQAYKYLRDYKGLDFVEEFYDVEHTQSFEDTVEDLSFYCKRMGGTLV